MYVLNIIKILSKTYFDTQEIVVFKNIIEENEK